MLESSFPIAAQESGLNGAKLELRRLTAKARCPSCGANLTVDGMWDRCTECGHGPVTIEGGRELIVKQIEVEDV